MFGQKFICRRFLSSADIHRCYKILGVNNTATENDIRKAFYKKSLIHHPDKNPEDTEESIKSFQEINEAYKILLEYKRSPNATIENNFDPRQQWRNRSQQFRTVKMTNPNIQRNTSPHSQAYQYNSKTQTYSKRKTTSTKINENDDGSWVDKEYRNMIEKDHQRMMNERQREQRMREGNRPNIPNKCVVM